MLEYAPDDAEDSGTVPENILDIWRLICLESTKGTVQIVHSPGSERLVSCSRLQHQQNSCFHSRDAS